MTEYRHEYKYYIPTQKLLCIKNQIEPIMFRDMHVGNDESYTIRSLYFDDYENSGFYENENGVDPREKFRLRIYNGDASLIKLELKQKYMGKTRKQSCIIPQALCESIINGNNYFAADIDSPVYRKFYIQQTTKFLRPKVIVEYERIPYIYPDGNVRITFDLNIRSCINIRSFLAPNIMTRSVMPTGQNILEVKFDELLPDFIHQSVQTEKLQQTNFSKYYICRKYNLGGTSL